MKRMLPTPRTILFLSLTSLAVVGCDCAGGGGLDTVAPVIKAIPAAITFDQVAVREEVVQVLLIQNDGSLELVVEDPVLIEEDTDGETELALRAVLVPVDCLTGAERATADPRRIMVGGCVSIEVVYIPQNLGSDLGSISIASNDPKTPVLEIPITASASAPDIEVCVLASSCSPVEVCNDASSGLTMDFPLTLIDDTVTCPVRISNTGALPLKNLGWEFKTGNRRRDYTLNPSDLGSLGDLDAATGVELTIDFTPRSGGPKEALLEITSSDPDEGAVTIRFTGLGDGPKVCPDPFPVVDFGPLEIGQTVSQDVELTNCGTLDLFVTALETQDGSGSGPSPQFALGAGAPTPPVGLGPGASTLVPVEFTPTAIGLFTGRLYLESSDPVVPSGWVNLVGEGIVPPACQLQASTQTVSFGSGAPSSVGGVPIEKTLAISNPGQLACTGVTVSITAGQSVAFSIVGFPAGIQPWTITPGQIVIFTLQYDPADTVGPDSGTISFDATELTSTLDVQLTGSPVSAPVCDLSVNPTPGTFQFGQCASLSFTPRVSQFGAVKISQSKMLPITVENIGSIGCNINAVSLQAVDLFAGIDPTFTLLSGQNRVMINGSLTNVIQPGEIGEVQIKYQPTSETQNCGAVWIETSNTAHPSECQTFTGSAPDGCYQVNFIGQGVRSAIEVIPGDVNFGRITVGCASQERDVTIYNIGGGALNITSVYITPSGSPFTITSVPNLPTTVAGGTSITMRVKYQPPDTNTHSANLIIESDAQNAGIMTVPLTGQGTNDPHQQDQFQQLNEPLVDVLWIVDDSCSMNEEQNNLANNAGAFLSRALNLNTDFQIGVVTTDMVDGAKSGRLQSRLSSPKIITRNSANPVTDFQNNVRQGTSGDFNERGLDAAHAALSDPLILDPAANLGFLRTDAKLVMITVSDEDDFSTPPVDFFVDFFKNIKGYRNSDLMSFSAVVGPEPSGCTSSDGDASSGSRYLEVARRTGGLERSICTSNWGQIADDLGLDAFGAKSQFFLSREAIPSTIEVRVAGQLVPQSDWSYDQPSNSIIFDPLSVPAQNATILVDYDTVCR